MYIGPLSTVEREREGGRGREREGERGRERERERGRGRGREGESFVGRALSSIITNRMRKQLHGTVLLPKQRSNNYCLNYSSICLTGLEALSTSVLAQVSTLEQLHSTSVLAGISALECQAFQILVGVHLIV